MCRNSRAGEPGEPELDPGARARRNCALALFDDRKWKGTELQPCYMGLPPKPEWRTETGWKQRAWETPPEDNENEGCPGGWYRCEWIRSLGKYRRRGSETKIENLLLTRCQDRLVLEAIQYLEDEEANSLGHFYEARDSD